MEFEVGIIGAGPAGYSAGIYAARSGLKTILFDTSDGGGHALLAPKVENYAGFDSISGAELVEKMKQHMKQYPVDVHFFESVKTVSQKKNLFMIETDKRKYTVGAIILCTGTEHKKLDVPGEQQLSGKGVSYCATCDGFFFRGKTVAVIGGGNSAVIEAIFLRQIGCSKVILIHRRDQLRAEQFYIHETSEKKIEVVLNTEVEKIEGTDAVQFLRLKNSVTGKHSVLPVDGVFVSIGKAPQNQLAKQLKVTLDSDGYVMVDRKQQTSVRGVYAAGDITGGVQQMITAAAEGAIAALSSTEAVGKKYPY